MKAIYFSVLLIWHTCAASNKVRFKFRWTRELGLDISVAFFAIYQKWAQTVPSVVVSTYFSFSCFLQEKVAQYFDCERSHGFEEAHI